MKKIILKTPLNLFKNYIRQHKKLTRVYNYTYLIILFIFSFFVNFYYANFGIEPMDTFVLYNGGFKVLNNLVPFKDYWLVTGL